MMLAPLGRRRGTPQLQRGMPLLHSFHSFSVLRSLAILPHYLLPDYLRITYNLLINALLLSALLPHAFQCCLARRAAAALAF